MKKLILNADDFCLSPVFNKSILSLLEEQVILSTTLMVKRYTSEQETQVERLVQIQGIGVGLHIEFESDENCAEQISNQYDRFIEIIGRKPTHLDMHKHVFREVAYPALMKFATEKGIPYRNSGFEYKEGKTTTLERFSAIGNWLDKIYLYVDSLQDGDSGELVLHPGTHDPDCQTSLNYEREVDILKARRVKEYADSIGVKLTHFGEL